ncbi:MAG: hypothetical protein II878_06090 [Bacteroidales bacterium]|nr:hypothetical protein [Bacteroidales bacterium]
MKRILLILLSVICCYTFALSQNLAPKSNKVSCYSKNRSKGISLYNQGKCAEAKKWFNVAKDCPDKPQKNDIATWISKCNNCNKKTVKTPNNPTKPTRPVNKESEWAKKSYMNITNLDFGSTDGEGNLEIEFGETLYSDLKYLATRIEYDGLADVEKNATIYVAIYDPDGNLLTGTSSPAGYTYSVDVTVEAGYYNSVTIPGWGNNYGTVYKSGTYLMKVFSSYGNELYRRNIYIRPAVVVEKPTETTGSFGFYGTSRSYSNSATGLKYLRDDVSEKGGFRTGAISTNGKGVIIRGNNGYAYTGIPTNLADKIKSLNKDNSKIEDVFFSPNGEYYGVVYDSYGYFAHTLQTMLDKLKEYNNNQEQITSVSVNNNGDFIIITDKHLYASNTNDYNAMIAAKDKYGYIYSACTTEEGVIFCCERGVYYSNIPTILENKLKSLSWKPRIIKFTDYGTFIVTDGENTYTYQM